MKLRVVGWTYYDDARFEDGGDSYAAHEAILADVKANGYDFTGWHHQEAERGAPVLSDGRIYRYSQRGWGGLMAEVVGDEDLFGYARYAFYYGEDDEGIRLPPLERDIGSLIYMAASELLDVQKYEYLFEEGYTTRFPHPEFGEEGIYTLSEEEVDSIGQIGIVRQLPNGVMRRVFGEDLHECFCLDAYACTKKEDRITLPMSPDLTYLDRGDTVILGGERYTVTRIEQYKDVPEEVRLHALYPLMDRHEEALEVYRQAQTMIDIYT